MTRCWFGWFVCGLIAVWFGASVTAAPDTSEPPAPPLEPAAPAADVRSIGPETMVATDVSVVTVDAVGDTGLNPSLVLDADGNPVIAYRDVTNGDLKLVHCDDPFCAGVETPVTVDSVGDTGRDPSLVLDGAGNPVIAYFERVGSEVEVASGPVRLVRCDDPNCEGVETPVVLDPSGPPGASISLALDAADHPIVAWAGLDVRGLIVLRCDDPACDGVEASVVADPFGLDDPSLVVDTGGDPVIAYRGGSSGQAELWLTRCADPACAATQSSVGLTGGDSGGFSLALDASDSPVTAYTGFIELVLVRCQDPNCAGEVATVRVDQRGWATGDRSMTLDAAGHPVIAYRNFSTEGGMRSSPVLLSCDDPVCAGDETRLVLDRGSASFDPPSLVLDAMGRPVVAYHDQDNGDLRLARCSAPGCVDVTGPRATIDLGVGQEAVVEAGPVTFAVVFDEPVVGFASGDVSVTGTAGATVATVSGDGPAYSVVVDAIAGAGTVTIDVAEGVVTDVAGNRSLPSVVVQDTVTVQGAPVPPPDPGTLPDTGSGRVVISLAMLFLLVGLSLLAIARRPIA